MALNLKNLLSRKPETISADKVLIKDFPVEELGLTLFYILLAGFWLVFSGEIVDWIMGVEINSPTVQTMRGINFVTTTGILLYLVLRRTSRRRRQATEPKNQGRSKSPKLLLRRARIGQRHRPAPAMQGSAAR